MGLIRNVFISFTRAAVHVGAAVASAVTVAEDRTATLSRRVGAAVALAAVAGTVDLTIRNSIACIVTLRGREATAEVIDYRGVGPSKYDCEDALYEARRWVRRNVRDADPAALFAPAWAQGEVAVFTLALGR